MVQVMLRISTTIIYVFCSFKLLLRQWMYLCVLYHVLSCIRSDDQHKLEDLPVHVVPSPLYPGLQAHAKDPSVLVQEALA